MVALEGIATTDIVAADVRGDVGLLVFEEWVEVGLFVVDPVALADAGDSGCVRFVVEGLVADVVELPCLGNGEVVFGDVALEERGRSSRRE